MKKQTQKVLDVVEAVLIQYPEARNDDFILYLRVITYTKGLAFAYCETLYDVLVKHQLYGLPSFESVSRARRKLQSELPQLKASKQIQEERAKQEAEMLELARAK